METSREFCDCTCDACDKRFDSRKEGSNGIDNEICGECLEEMGGE